MAGNPKTSRRAQRPVLVLTGAHGFLGARLLERLLSERRYRKILILDIKPPKKSSRICKFHYADLTEPGSDRTIAEILDKEHVDIVVHLAFHSSPQHDERMTHELSVIGTLNMLKACDRVPVRKLIVQSSTLIYGADYRNPIQLGETHQLNGSQSYEFVRDKVEVEKMVGKLARSCPQTTITSLRFCPILSRHYSQYITDFLDRSIVLTSLGYDPLVQFLHEEDGLAALEKATDGDHPGAFNIVGRGVMYLSTVLWLAGKTNLPVPSPFAGPVMDLLWYLKMSDAPGSHLDFFRFSCIASGERALKEMGFAARYSTKETLLAYLGKERVAT